MIAGGSPPAHRDHDKIVRRGPPAARKTLARPLQSSLPMRRQAFTFVLLPALLTVPACDKAPACPNGSDDPTCNGNGDTDGAGDTPNEIRPCEASPKLVQYCTASLQWGVCVDPDTACTPGSVRSKSCNLGEEFGDLNYQEKCTLTPDGIPQWEAIDEEACNTPLVLVPQGLTPRFMPDATHTFAVSGPGASCLTTDWPTADTPWLARDLDGNGVIDGGHELFGSGTRLPSGRRADHGFAALAPLDANGDHILDARDPAFLELLLWADRDGDRRSSPDELAPLRAAGVSSLSLDLTVDPVCDDRGNCGRERAPVVATRPATLVDVYLPCR